jgi:hypothetical protein
MSKDTPYSPAVKFILAAWNAIPGGSWQRLNSGMGCALGNAVASGMSFQLDDMAVLSKETRMGRWIGANHEGYYSNACGGQRGAANPSFCQAYEKWLNREPFLWPEITKTPTRLNVRAKFTWQGHFVTVTSFSGDGAYLTAVTYKDGDRSEIDRRFKVTLAEIKAHRKEADAKRRKYEKEMAAAETLAQLKEVEARIVAIGRAGFRHFDVEELRAAYSKRSAEITKGIEDALRAERDVIRKAQYEEEKTRLAATHDTDLARWLNGEAVDRYFDVVRLRINGEWVETSTGQRATLKGVRVVLGFLAKHRAGWKANGSRFNLDEFPIREISESGVQVGCTLVEWAEVDRIVELLKPNS